MNLQATKQKKIMIAANDEQHSPQKKTNQKIKSNYTSKTKKHIQPQKKTHPNM
jgi:hypothetical protein